MKILLTNVGRRTYFVDFLEKIKNNSLKDLEIHLSDCSKLAASFYNRKNIKIHITPKATQNKNKYFQSILRVVKKNKINILIPLSDYDLNILSIKKSLLEKNKCKVIISNKEVIKTCFSKTETTKFLKKNKFTFPKTWFSQNQFKKKYPVIIKNIYGSASLGQKIIFENRDLKFTNFKKKIIQELVVGKEYNLDILNDFHGNYLDSCAKIKLSMRAGETDKAKIVNNPKLILIAKKISKDLRHIGNLDCDLIIDKKGKVNILDFNPRFGGGYPFTHMAGKNYLYKIIKMTLGEFYKLKKYPKIITGMKGIDIKTFN